MHQRTDDRLAIEGHKPRSSGLQSFMPSSGAMVPPRVTYSVRMAEVGRPSRGRGLHREDLDVLDDNYDRPDLTTFARLDTLGLEVTGRWLDPDRDPRGRGPGRGPPARPVPPPHIRPAVLSTMYRM